MRCYNETMWQLHTLEYQAWVALGILRKNHRFMIFSLIKFQNLGISENLWQNLKGYILEGTWRDIIPTC